MPGKSTSETDTISMLAGITGGKCPHCRKGKMFRFPFWNLFRFAKQNHQCNHCAQDFLIEPGFYYGAMYFTYIVNVIAIIGGICILYFGFEIENPLMLSLPVVVIITGIVPLNFRLSRVLWLYFFGDIVYHPNLKSEFPSQS